MFNRPSSVMVIRVTLTLATVSLGAGSQDASAFITGNGDPKWGDPTLGTGAVVTYSFSLGTETIMEGGQPVQTVPLDSVFPAGYELELERALIMWAAHGDLDFRRVQDGLFGSAVDIAISAHPRDPEDNYLAHASLPPGGDAHFASNLPGPWGFIDAAPGPHILTTAAHEFGHSLGLLHAGPDNQGTSIMQGGGLFIDGTHETIWQDDINAMHFLYGPAGGATWDPDFNNLAGNWNDDQRWFTNSEPNAATEVTIFNGNLAVTSTGEQAASLQLGGMSDGLVRMIGAGELTVAGETVIRSGGRLAMLGGSVMTQTLDLSDGGTIVQRVGDTPFEVLEATGAAILDGGTLDISPVGGFEFSSGDVFNMLTADSISGEFETLSVPSLDPTLTALLDYDTNQVQLFIVRAGDVNFDGSVAIDDWTQIRSHLFSSSAGLPIETAYAQGDLNNDGQTDELDFGLFKEVYELANGLGSFEAANIVVPEPSAMVMCVLAILSCILPTRRRPLAIDYMTS